MIYFFRTIVAMVCVCTGILAARKTGLDTISGTLMGLAIALLIILGELILGRYPLKKVGIGAIGLLIGLIIANMLAFVFSLIPLLGEYRSYVFLVMNLAFGYLGIVTAVKKSEEFYLSAGRSSTIPVQARSNGNLQILDTSVIIDGRIADICETNFIEGTIVIPRFILRELQHIADSSDSLKRTRGRRGLEILKKMQQMKNIDVVIDETDLVDMRGVDTKLVKLAKKLGGKIITNDFNLNKIAELDGVQVLNINQLACAIRPVVLPGEDMTIRLMRKGKELDQAIGYLEDGTMIVVDDAKDYLGKNVTVTVTSVLQTTAGRMIFAKIENANHTYKHEHSSIQ